VANPGIDTQQARNGTGENMNYTDIRTTNYVTEEILDAKLDAAILQIHEERADDRKRITVLEDFSREIYSILWVKFRSIRTELENQLKKHVPYFFSRSTAKQSMAEAET